MADLYDRSHALVHPARAECVGLSIVEGVLAGLPIITTRYSAPADYLGDDYPIWLEEYELLRPGPARWTPELITGDTAEGITSFYKQYFPSDLKWAVVSVPELRKKMREVFEMSDEERSRRGREGAEDLKRKFDWNNGIIQKRAKRTKEVNGDI